MKISEKLGCACGIIGNISVNNILWDLFHKILTFDVEHIDFYKKTGILVKNLSELITINDKKIPMIGCRNIRPNGILQRKNNFLLFGTCGTTDSSTLVLILLFNREGTVENMFTFKLERRIQIDPSNDIPGNVTEWWSPPIIGPKSPAESPAHTPAR